MGAFGVISFGIVWAYYLYENKQRRSGRREALADGRTEEELKELGDKSPRFIFVT